MKTFYTYLLLSICLVSFSCNENEVSFKRPNILFITTDYMRGVDLPATGAPFLHAPTLNKLCEEGAVFTRHCCVAPICMPARASIVTGHYPHSHSLWDNRNISVRQSNLPFLITDLKNQDYQTIGIGKMHFYPFPGEYDYDVRISLEGKGRNYRDDDYEKYLEEKGSSRKAIAALSDGTATPRGQSFFDWTLDEKLHPDAFVGIKTVETIQNKILSKDRHWFMWVSFTGPHNPWNAPERYAKIYREMSDLPTGNFVEGELALKPLDYTRHRYGYGGDLMQIYDNLNSAEKVVMRKNLRAGHYGSLSFIDEWIGKIMEELRRENHLDNTIIIFSSDHGSALFDNEMLHKGSPFPTQGLVPFVVWYPGKIKPGIRKEFTTHADLYATFLDLAGNNNPHLNEGKSLVELFTTPGKKVNDFVIYESTMVTSIMNNKWLAGFHHITKEVELYDIENDPMCHLNIANKKECQEIIEQLESKVVSWRKGLAKPGEIVKDDIFRWYDELGDTTYLSKYFEIYINEFKRLANFPDEYTGVTGTAATNILKESGLLE